MRIAGKFKSDGMLLKRCVADLFWSDSESIAFWVKRTVEAIMSSIHGKHINEITIVSEDGFRWAMRFNHPEEIFKTSVEDWRLAKMKCAPRVKQQLQLTGPEGWPDQEDDDRFEDESDRDDKDTADTEDDD